MRFGRPLQCAGMHNGPVTNSPLHGPAPVVDTRLESWKEIAAYLRRDVTTVQRWEKREGLPVHRHLHLKQGSVYAFKGELDAWREARLTASATNPDVIPSERGRRPGWRSAIALVIVASAIGIASGWASRFWGSSDVQNGLGEVLLPVTTLSGDEMRPGLSPDGSQVAFFWGGENNDDGGLYVAAVGAPEKRRLTDSRPGHDNFARWSPNGASIAFVRHGVEARDAGGQLHIVSPLGGPERKVSDLPFLGPLAWSPDSRYIAAPRWAPAENQGSTGIHLISLAGGEPRRLTDTQAPFRDTGVAFSPDGRTLAYASCNPRCDLYLAALDASFMPAGSPRRLTTQSLGYIGVVAWTRDGKTVIYDSALGSGLSQLMRVAIDGTRGPERIELAGLNAFAPATATFADRLVFSRHYSDLDIYKLQPDRASTPAVASTFPDYDPSFAPREDKIAFASARDGSVAEIWVAASDGSGAQRLTQGPGRWQTSPQWSPDGTHIAFDSLASDGRFHVWIIAATGGAPRRLTTATGDQRFPTWSRDGQSIYYRLDDGNACDIWKVPAAGGADERLTRTGNAIRGYEMSDGKRLVYQTKLATGGSGCDPFGSGQLMVVPLEGGAPTQLVTCTTVNSVSVRPAGISYVPCQGNFRASPPLYEQDTDSGKISVLATLDGLSNSHGMAVSRDGKRILYPRYRAMGVDVFLIENFR